MATFPENALTSARMGEIFDLYSPEIDADPFPAYERLREQHPCYWSESGRFWILSRYDDVFKAAQNWETYSSAQGNLVDEIPTRPGATLGTTDPPRHDRLRALTQAAFTKRNLEYLVTPTREIAARALDRIGTQGRFDFVAEYANEITVGILFLMLGLPPPDRDAIRRKVVLSISTDKRIRGRSAEHDRAFQEIGDFIAGEVTVRRQNPQDDLITRLAEAEIDGDRLSEREVVLTTTMFVIAGIESLSSFMSILALNLHDHPEARHRLAQDPGLVAPAIEESLRFNTSAQRFKRVATRDVDLHGQRIRRGDKVVLAFGSANRDWRKFPDPDRYDIDRRPQGHLGFGSGKHFCIGSQLARLVTETAMRDFLARIPHYRLAPEPVQWNSSSNFRMPFALRFEILIDAVRERAKLPHQVAVELRPHIQEQLIRPCPGHRRAVRTPLDQCAVDVGDRQGAHQIGDLVRLEAVRIPGPVEIFVVMQDHVEHFGMQAGGVAQRFVSEFRMGAHDCDFLLAQRRWLFQNLDRDARLAEVMQQAGRGQALLVGRREAETPAERHRDRCDDQAMLERLAVVLANDLEPVRQPVFIDSLDDVGARRLDHLQVGERAGERRGKHVLQGTHADRDAAAICR